MENITDDKPPPAELKLAWQCEKWQTLPDAGGLGDQDFITMHRMNVYTNIHNTVQRARSLKGKDIHKLTDSERRVLRFLMDLGILFHA